MVHSVSGWMRGVQVKLWDPLRMRAIPERLRGVTMTRRYINPPLPLPESWSCLKRSRPESKFGYSSQIQGTKTSATDRHMWVGTMSTSQRVVMPCGWGVKAGMVRVWVAGKTVWSLVTHGSYLSALEVRSLYIKCYINASVYLHVITTHLKKCFCSSVQIHRFLHALCDEHLKACLERFFRYKQNHRKMTRALNFWKQHIFSRTTINNIALYWQGSTQRTGGQFSLNLHASASKLQ